MPTLADRIRQTKGFESASHEAMLALITAAADVRADVERVCKDYGLTFAHYNVLRILEGGRASDEGGYHRCDIAERMIDPGPDVTRLCNRLEKKGLVERGPSPADLRATLHRITNAGQQLLSEMRTGISAVHDHFGADFDETELASITRLCERIYGRSK